MNKVTGILIMPETDEEMIRAKHWLVARRKTYKMVYLPITVDEKATVIMTEFNLWDKILYWLTFRPKSEKLTAFS